VTDLPSITATTGDRTINLGHLRALVAAADHADLPDDHPVYTLGLADLTPLIPLEKLWGRRIHRIALRRPSTWAALYQRLKEAP